jgi:hypothetical protein
VRRLHAQRNGPMTLVASTREIRAASIASTRLSACQRCWRARQASNDVSHASKKPGGVRFDRTSAATATAATPLPGCPAPRDGSVPVRAKVHATS